MSAAQQRPSKSKVLSSSSSSTNDPIQKKKQRARADRRNKSVRYLQSHAQRHADNFGDSVIVVVRSNRYANCIRFFSSDPAFLSKVLDGSLASTAPTAAESADDDDDDDDNKRNFGTLRARSPSPPPVAPVSTTPKVIFPRTSGGPMTLEMKAARAKAVAEAAIADAARAQVAADAVIAQRANLMKARAKAAAGEDDTELILHTPRQQK
jgi:hypothetical protein